MRSVSASPVHGPRVIGRRFTQMNADLGCVARVPHETDLLSRTTLCLFCKTLTPTRPHPESPRSPPQADERGEGPAPLQLRVSEEDQLLVGVAGLRDDRTLTDPIAQTCHLDRVRRSATPEEEWRDPEDASSAMPRRGVLPRLRVLSFCPGSDVSRYA